MPRILILGAGLFLSLGVQATPTLETADQFFRQRADATLARKALENYRLLSQAGELRAEIEWRRSMACQFVGYRLTTDEEERKQFYKEGVDSGRRALKNDPNCVPCHFWTGINMALHGEAVGPFRTIVTLKEVRSHLLFVAKVDPAYASAGALRVLGIIEWKLPGILGGSNARAKEYFEKAIQLLPHEPLNYLFLVRLLKDMGKTQDADVLLQKTASIPLPPSDQIESYEAWKDLESLRNG